MKATWLRRSHLLLVSALLTTFLLACASNQITGRRQLIIIPESVAINQSAPAFLQMMEPVAAEGRLDTPAEMAARVKRITSHLVAQAVEFRPDTKDWQWEMRLIDDRQMINAFAMAGGRMAVYSGIIVQLELSDDELAQIIGHEIAHALLNHTAERMSVALATNASVGALGMIFEEQPLAVQGASLAALAAITLPNSRTSEAEADVVGVELAARAGYHPAAAISLWQKMEQASDNRMPQFLSTHPSPANRQQGLAQLQPQMLPLYEQAVTQPRASWPVR